MIEFLQQNSSSLLPATITLSYQLLWDIMQLGSLRSKLKPQNILNLAQTNEKYLFLKVSLLALEATLHHLHSDITQRKDLNYLCHQL